MRMAAAITLALTAIIISAVGVQAGDRTPIQARTGTTTVGHGCTTGGTPTGPTLGTATLSWQARRVRTQVAIALTAAAPNTTYSINLAEYVNDGEICWFGSIGEQTTDGSGDLRYRVTLNSYVQGQYRIELWLTPLSGGAALFAGGIDTPTS